MGIIIGIVCLIVNNIKKEKEAKEREIEQEEEKTNFENWVTNLKNGEEVEFRQCKIKVTEEKIIINDFQHNIILINKLLFREKLKEVYKYSYYTGGGLRCRDIMTPYEYYKDLEYNRKHYYPSDRYSYSFVKEYFISIEFINRFSPKSGIVYDDFSIGYEDIQDKDEQLLLELNNYLTEIKERIEKQ